MTNVIIRCMELNMLVALGYRVGAERINKRGAKHEPQAKPVSERDIAGVD